MDDDQLLLSWQQLYTDRAILFGLKSRCCVSAVDDQQSLHSEAQKNSSRRRRRRRKRLTRRTMLCRQDVDQQRRMRRLRPSSTGGDDSSEWSPEDDDPLFRLSADENNNNNNDDDDEQQLKFSIDKILSADFGQNDCIQRHQHHQTTTTTTYASDSKTHRHHQQLQQQQRAENARDRINFQLKSNESVKNGGEEMRGGERRGVRGDDAYEINRKPRNATKQNGNLEESRMESASVSSAALSGSAARTDCAGLPAWIFCTRYSDRPCSGQRSRKSERRKDNERELESGRATGSRRSDEKRVRTCFTDVQLDRLKAEFKDSPYLTEERRSKLSTLLNLTEVQVKIWFQNKRAKMKKSILATAAASSSSSSTSTSLPAAAATAAATAAAREGQQLYEAASSALHGARLTSDGLCNCRISMTDTGRRRHTD